MEQIQFNVQGTPSKTHLRMLSAFKAALKEKIGFGCLKIFIEWNSKQPCPTVVEGDSLSLSTVSSVQSPQAKRYNKENRVQTGQQEGINHLISTGSVRPAESEGADPGLYWTTNIVSDAEQLEIYRNFQETDSVPESLIIQLDGSHIGAPNTRDPFPVATDCDDGSVDRLSEESLTSWNDDEVADMRAISDEIGANDPTESEMLDPGLSQQSTTFQSQDVVLPGSANRIHLGIPLLKAMEATNALKLAKDPRWLAGRAARLARGVKRRERDAFDDAGKITLERIFTFLGISASQVILDSAQAGGVCANADGFLTRIKQFLEVKACRAKARNDRVPGSKANPQCTVQDLRFGASWWGQLLAVLRERDPVDWADVNEYEACGFWIGITSRSSCEAALQAKGMSLDATYTAVVTPHERDGPAARHRGWLGPCFEWVQVGKLLRDPAERERFKARLGLA